MKELIIVEAEAVVRLGKFQKAWMVGWVVATLALVAVGVQSGRLHEATKQAKTLEAMLDQVRAVQAEQKTVTASYVKAWENQQATANLLVTWGTYVKDRTEIAQQALLGQPPNLYARKP